MTALVTCPGRDGQLCTGQLTLRALERIRGRTIVAVSARQEIHVTTVALGHTSFAVPAPGQRRLSMPTLDADGRRLLGEFYRLPGRLTFPGTALAARTVIFDYPVIGDVIKYTASWGLRYTTMTRVHSDRSARACKRAAALPRAGVPVSPPHKPPQRRRPGP